ncbi:unnamed protein product, partial [marine sediment metagenome]
MGDLGKYKPELKACPFCGGAAEMREPYQDDNGPSWYTVVECTGCGVEQCATMTPHKSLYWDAG